MLTLVLPLLLSITLYADSPGTLNAIILAPIALLLLIPRREQDMPFPSTLRSRPSSSPLRDSARPAQDIPPPPTNVLIPRIPALTTYRAHMLLLTFLCILAVDFPVFPRMLAKCETYGASLVGLAPSPV